MFGSCLMIACTSKQTMPLNLEACYTVVTSQAALAPSEPQQVRMVFWTFVIFNCCSELLTFTRSPAMLKLLECCRSGLRLNNPKGPT